MHKYFCFLLSCIALNVSAQNFTLSGYIEDAETGEKLVGANLINADTYDGTISNTFGFYSLTQSKGKINIQASYIGYANYTSTVELNSDQTLVIKLAPSSFLETVEIVAEKQKNIAEESEMSTIKIPIAQIKKVPSLMGEVDVLKSLQLLPGVQSGGEGQSGLYVRGGSPDQNLILLDGVPVYNASHLFGFFSVFNADAIKDVKLVKGGFPARYGGRLSSVLEINMKEGNMNEFHGSGSFGLVASRLTVEGPIVPGKTSFLLSGRRTYIDLLAKPFIKREFEDEGNDGSTGYYFYDLNAKVNHIFSKKDRLYLSYYGGDDRFYFDEKENDAIDQEFTKSSLGWGNVTSALRWNHLWAPKLFSNLTLTYSKYKLDTGVEYGTDYTNESRIERIALDYDSGIRDIAAKIDFDFIPNPNHFIRTGISVIQHRFFPGTFSLLQEGELDAPDFNESVGQDTVPTQEIDVYLEDDWKISNKLKANAGIHFSGFNVKGKFYTSFQPRFSARYLLSENQSLKFSFATMRQYIHLLAFEGIGLPTDLWVPTTAEVEPQDSWQIAAGYAFKLSDAIDITVEGFYKEMDNLISYKEGSGLFELGDWQERVIQGEGRSYGLELFIQKKTGRLNGWIGYTLSWSDRLFDELNFGNRFPYRFDRRHDISIVAQYELGPKVNLAATWVYGTGNAVTLAGSEYEVYYPGSYSGISEFHYNQSRVNYLEDKNNYRMNAYHRLDIGINFVKPKPKFKSIFSIGAYNTYNRNNPFFIYTQTDTNPDSGANEKSLRQQSLFPIIPYFTYNFEF